MHPHNDDRHPVELSEDRARQGVTGLHVRYILAFGIAAVVIAFVLVALLE
jgi:hypothetical protein